MDIETAEDIKSEFAKHLQVHGIAIPISCLCYTIDEYKEAFRTIAIHPNIYYEYLDALYAGLWGIADIFEDADAQLIKNIKTKHTSKEQDRITLLLKISKARYEALSMEWDLWMLDRESCASSQ